MAGSEIKYSITPGPECGHCPNRIRTKGANDPNDTIEKCPRDKVIVLTGNTSTLPDLDKIAREHGLIYKGKLEGRLADFTPMLIYQCPNNENDKLAGNIMVERPLI